MGPYRGQSFRSQLAIGCIVFLAFCRCEAFAADWKQRLLSEAPAKWAALEQYYSKMEASYRKIFAVPSEGKPFPLTFQGTMYYDARQNGEMIVFTDHKVGKDREGKQLDTTIVRGLNSRYAFTLVKITPDAEAFVLSDFQAVNDKARQKARGSGGSEYNMPFTVQFARLIDLIKDPLLTFDVSGVQLNGRELMQLEYNRKLVRGGHTDPPNKQPDWIERGTVVLDPGQVWSVKEYHVDNPNWKLDGVLEYGDQIDGFPILRRCTHTATHKQMGTEIITYEFDKLVHRDIPESEFTLSAFGLPEVQVPGGQAPRTLWRWLIGVGIGLAVAAVLLRAYAKKKRQAPHQV